jgi:hypothetical protein
MEIKRFVSQPPKTFFAPTWDYSVLEGDISSLINVEKYKNLVLSLEKEVIKKYEFTSDWDTGLGPNSMTSRSDKFNLLKVEGTDDLKQAIKNSANKFLSDLGQPEEPFFYVQCWSNVMRKGEKINKHKHYSTPYCYLGGHICITANNTNTYYENPYAYETFASPNSPGKLTIFPNWIEHYTDVVSDDSERITIAFDILNQFVFEEDIYDHKKDHWVKI